MFTKGIHKIKKKFLDWLFLKLYGHRLNVPYDEFDIFVGTYHGWKTWKIPEDAKKLTVWIRPKTGMDIAKRIGGYNEIFREGTASTNVYEALYDYYVKKHKRTT